MTGYAWEREFFGLSSKDIKANVPFIHRNKATRKAFTEQSMYKWDPFAPNTVIARELFECVKSYMAPDQAKKLGIYCALGTALDYYYKTDGFFKIKNIILPFDLKARPSTEDDQVQRTFVISQEQCDGPFIWRIAFKIAQAMDPQNGATWVYKLL